MAAYTQFGCGYPSANQFLPGSSLVAISSLSNVQSPIATTSNAPSLSPPSVGRESGGSSSAGGGTLTPDPTSQASASGGPSAATGTAYDGIPATYTCGPGGIGGIMANAPPPLPLCCDNGRPVMTDPVSGQTVCSCQYDPARLALSSYSRIQSAASVGVYGTPYPSNEQNPYPSIGVESTPFYSTLSNPYALKDTGNSSDIAAWTSASLQPTAGYYTYDPTFTAYGYGAANYDLVSRRKNATRESTTTLKAWLNEHKKNPYPTKGEKIMLAIITKMTLTQVSTWFANARRRLKKENKMTWEPKNRAEEDDDEMLPSDEEKEHGELVAEETEKRQRIDANVTTGSSSHAGNRNETASGAGADAGEVAAPSVGVGGNIGSTGTGTVMGAGTATAIGSGAGMCMSVGVGVDVDVISAQPKERPSGLYQLYQNQVYSAIDMPAIQFRNDEQPQNFISTYRIEQLKEQAPRENKTKVWNFANVGPDVSNSANRFAETTARNEWTRNYYQHYNAPLQTAVVAKISMQPHSPMDQPSSQTSTYQRTLESRAPTHINGRDICHNAPSNDSVEPNANLSGVGNRQQYGT